MVDPRPYVSETEISLGDMRLPSYVDINQVIETACNDIDAELGKFYVLPLDLDPENQQHLAAMHMLAKIARYYVIGRIVIDAAIASEDNSLQAYGNFHLRSAERALDALASGKVIIPDQQLILDESQKVTGPMVINREPRSLVDAFYNGDALPYGDINNPTYLPPSYYGTY